MPKTVQKGRIQKHHKFQYSPAKVNLALNAISEGMAISRASTVFNVPRTTLRNKVSGKSPRDSTGQCGFISFLGEETEKTLVDWILDCAKMGFPINKDGLLTSVQKLVTELNIKTPFPNNRPGKKWYYGFLRRHKEISQKKSEYIHGGRGAVTEERIRMWFDEIYKTLNEMNVIDVLSEPDRLFNMDETGFPLAPKSGIILGPRGKHVYDERSSSDKENVTTLFAVNAAGKFAPALTLFKYDRIPKAILKLAPKGWGLGKSENGWMTSECFFEYFSNVFVPFLHEIKIKFPVIIFLDGHKSHLTLHLSRFCRENQIILVALVPNATHILQPLDVAVFGPIKKKWQNISRKFKIDNGGNEITKGQLPLILSDIITDQKMTENIKSGFRATGLYPFSANNVDYSKIILRKTGLERIQAFNDEVVKHLTYFEQKIDPVLLDQFKMTRRRNHEWEGKPEALCLFTVWLDISKEAELSAKDIVNPANEIDDVNDNIENEPITLSTLAETHTFTKTPSPIWLRNTNENDAALTRFQENEQPSTSSILTDTNQVKKVESVKRNILTTSKSRFSIVLESILPYPGEIKTRKQTQKKQSTPCSVITSDKWLEIEEEKERIKTQKEQEKLERKRARELKKLKMQEEKIEKQTKKRTRKQNVEAEVEDTSSEEEWKESGSSGDDIDILEDSTSEIEILKAENLKSGDFILAKFKGTGKRMATIYKYVAIVLKVLSNEEYQIKCLKSLNKQKTNFDYIENDVSIISNQHIIGQLPEPILEQSGRRLITKFSGSVNVYEKY